MHLDPCSYLFFLTDLVFFQLWFQINCNNAGGKTMDEYYFSKLRYQSTLIRMGRMDMDLDFVNQDWL